ncbi:hypothetical protein ACOSQ2_023456 [Xanthoceras sorbifolium]
MRAFSPVRRGAGDGKPSAPYKSGSDELRLREEYQTTFEGDTGTNSGETKGSGLQPPLPAVAQVESSVSQGSHHVTASKLAFSSTESGSIERPTGTRRGRWKRLAREGMAYDPGPDPMDFRILFFCSCCAASSGIRAEFNKTLKEKFAKHNLELDTKFDMILKKLEELKPTNTHPPIRETQNIDSSATHTEHKIPIDIDESETQHDKTLPNKVRGAITNKPKEVAYVNQPYKRNTLQTPTKSRSHKDDSFEDYDSDEEDMIDADQAKRWRDDKRLKEGQQQV